MKRIYMYSIFTIVSIIIVTSFVVYYKFFRTAKEFILDHEDKYIVTTNTSIITAMSDGGTRYEVRYNVDLANKKVTKVEDYYKGFEGCKYKNRIKYEKKLSNEEAEQFKHLIKEVKENEIEKEYIPFGYKLEHLNDDLIEIYSKEYIDKMEVLLEK